MVKFPVHGAERRHKYVIVHEEHGIVLGIIAQTCQDVIPEIGLRDVIELCVDLLELIIPLLEIRGTGLVDDRELIDYGFTEELLHGPEKQFQLQSPIF